MTRAMQSTCATGAVAPSTRRVLLCLLDAARPHQWSKNLLVLAPAVLGHRLLDAGVLWRVGLAFVAFSAVASAGYLVNDMLDAAVDRQDERTRGRPFAAGRLTVRQGLLATVVLLCFGAALALPLGHPFAAVAFGYFALSAAYSLVLKRVALVDLMALVALYTARVVGGSVATDVDISFWLYSFCLFAFFSLAVMKRFVTLRRLDDGAKGPLAARAYRQSDEEALGWLGGGAGMVAVLVLVLYVHGDEVQRLYARPSWLAAVPVLFLFWMARLWWLLGRKVIHQEPLLFVMRDSVSYAVLALALAAAVLAA